MPSFAAVKRAPGGSSSLPVDFGAALAASAFGWTGLASAVVASSFFLSA